MPGFGTHPHAVWGVQAGHRHRAVLYWLFGTLYWYLVPWTSWVNVLFTAASSHWRSLIDLCLIWFHIFLVCSSGCSVCVCYGSLCFPDPYLHSRLCCLLCLSYGIVCLFCLNIQFLQYWLKHYIIVFFLLVVVVVIVFGATDCTLRFNFSKQRSSVSYAADCNSSAVRPATLK